MRPIIGSGGAIGKFAQGETGETGETSVCDAAFVKPRAPVCIGVHATSAFPVITWADMGVERERAYLKRDPRVDAFRAAISVGTLRVVVLELPTARRRRVWVTWRKRIMVMAFLMSGARLRIFLSYICAALQLGELSKKIRRDETKLLEDRRSLDHATIKSMFQIWTLECGIAFTDIITVTSFMICIWISSRARSAKI